MSYKSRMIKNPLAGKFVQTSEVKKMTNNFSWIILNKIINMVTGLMISVIITRYLGAENNGVISYVTAFTALFGILTTMGMQDIVVKEFAKDLSNSGKIAGSAFFISIIGSVVAFFLAVFSAVVINLPGYYVLYIAIAAIQFLTNPLTVLQYWFYANSNSKYYSITQNLTYIVSLLLKILCVILELPIIYFIIITTIETIALNLGLFIAYKISKIKFTKIKVSKKMAIHLFKVCWPLIFSTLAVTIYMKSDQLMIGTMLGKYELGIYSVAVRLAEYWYFVPGAIFTSVLPMLSSYYTNNHQKFMEKLEIVSDVLAVLGYCAAVFFTIFSRQIVGFLYGSEYLAAATILTIYIWAGLFVSLGNVKLIYCTLSEFSKFQLITTCVGAILNIIINYLLIPIYGAMGSAIATVITQAFNGWFSCILMKKTREIFKIQSKSLFPFIRISKRVCSFIKKNKFI